MRRAATPTNVPDVCTSCSQSLLRCRLRPGQACCTPLIVRIDGDQGQERPGAAKTGVVQIRVTSKTRNPFATRALSISGVTWKWYDTVGEVGCLFVHGASGFGKASFLRSR